MFGGLDEVTLWAVVCPPQMYAIIYCEQCRLAHVVYCLKTRPN